VVVAVAVVAGRSCSYHAPDAWLDDERPEGGDRQRKDGRIKFCVCHC